jgi:hypothetical protein
VTTPRARRIPVVARTTPWYSGEVSTDESAPPPAPTPLATQSHWELHAPHYWIVVAAFTLIPAALLAPLFQWVVGRPDLAGVVGLGKCFLTLVTIIGIVVACVVFFWSDQPGAGYLRRPLYRVSVFEHGVELRDGHDAVLGVTANGTLRVASVNIQIGQQMSGAAQLVHRGGMITLRPARTLAPSPGQPAVPHHGRWISVADDMYAQVLRFAS